MNKEETIEEETEDLLNRVYNGSLLLMVQSAVRGRGMSEEDMESLKALLAKGKGMMGEHIQRILIISAQERRLYWRLY